VKNNYQSFRSSWCHTSIPKNADSQYFCSAHSWSEF